MPKGLDRADRKLVIAAGAFLLVLLAASVLVSPQREAGGAAFPSSDSAAWDGAKGAYTLLEETGYRVERWEKPPGELPVDFESEVLVLAEPLVPPSEDDVHAIEEFLRGGGRVVAAGGPASRLLPNAGYFEEGNALDGSREFSAQLPSPLARGAEKIEMPAPAGWRPDKPGHLAVYGDEDTAAVVSYGYGRGQIVWWGSSAPLTNSGIRKADNLRLFLNSVGARQDTRIFWDEYFHGARASFWSYVARTPLPWGILQCGLVFAAVLATFSRRNGPVRAAAKVSRLSPMEFVETLGDLYAAGHAGSAAVKNVCQRLRFLLARKLGLPADAQAAELAQRADRSLGWDEQAFRTALQRGEAAIQQERIKDSEALEIVQELLRYTERLETGKTGARERETE